MALNTPSIVPGRSTYPHRFAELRLVIEEILIKLCRLKFPGLQSTTFFRVAVQRTVLVAKRPVTFGYGFLASRTGAWYLNSYPTRVAITWHVNLLSNHQLSIRTQYTRLRPLMHHRLGSSRFLLHLGCLLPIQCRLPHPIRSDPRGGSRMGA